MSWKYVQYENGKMKTTSSGGGGSSTLEGLDDTNISSPSNKQVLQYNSTQSKWVNSNPAVSDVKVDGTTVVNQNGVALITTPDIDKLGKVQIASPSDGQVLKYDGTTEKWINGTSETFTGVTDVQLDGTTVVNQNNVAVLTTPTMSKISDVYITGITNGQILKYNSSTNRWENSTGGGGASALSDLTDTNITSPTNNQILKYNSSTSKWENANGGSSGGVSDVTLDGVSVVNGNNVAVLTSPTIPVTDVKVDGTSVVSQGVALITSPTIPVTDVKVDGTSVVSQGVAQITSITPPVDDVLVNGTTVVDANKKAQIKSYKEVTQAQYESLPDSKLTDGILYAIKDGGAAIDGFPPLIYSDEEREVGVWRDGKPLYQKTLTGTFNNATTNQILELTNETIVKADGYLMLNDGSSNTIQLGAYLLNNYYCGWYVYSGSLYIFCSSGFANSNYAIVISYTKSTDTPGSGTWTTQGTVAHHYSTTEHVIGTWIDGKPLYEKVLEYTNLTVINTETDTYQNISLSSLNIDFMVDIDGIWERIWGTNNKRVAKFGFYEKTSSQVIHANIRWDAASSRLQHCIVIPSGQTCSWAKIIIRYTKSTD